MSYITTTDAHGKEVNLHYNDLGSGRPVVLVHGWPSSKEMFDYQTLALAEAGFRVVAYDRRGFGRSSKPWDGYDYDTFAADLKAVLEQLDLHDVTLVGFSMGGGEVVRYMSRYGGERVSKAVLIGSIIPYMLKTNDNPEGVPQEVFDGMLKNIREDRMAFLDEFGKQFFGVNFINRPISGPSLKYYGHLCEVSLPRAMEQCVMAFAGTDFRSEVASLHVPTLIIHGDSDKIVPKEVSSDRTAQMIPHAQYKVYEGGPHGIFHTHKDQLNADLIAFLRK